MCYTTLQPWNWEKCDIPDEITFQTKPELALEMLKAVLAEGTLRFRCVACDEAYGKDLDFLDGVASLEHWYFGELPRLFLYRAWKFVSTARADLICIEGR